MNNRLPLSSDAKRRKLDELFASEPHLSPTMKARRLHEKQEADEYLEELRARRPAGAPEPEKPAAMTPAEEEIDFDLLVFMDRPQNLKPEEMVSLSQAAAYLRYTSGASQTEPGPMDYTATSRLVRFRERALKIWLNGIPGRESRF